MEASTARPAHVVVDGPGMETRAFSLKEGITSIGRLPGNDLILTDGLVSRHHARISLFDGRATLQDLSSHNGSFINERRVYTASLHEDDVIRIGGFRLRFAFGRAPEDVGPKPSRTSVALNARTQPHTPPGLSSLLLRLVDMAVASQADVPLDRATSGIEHAFHTDSCAIIRSKRNGRATVVAGRQRGEATDAPEVDGSVVQWVLERRFPVALSCPADDPRFPDSHTRHAVASVPIGSQGDLLGALYVARPGPTFSLADLDGLQGVAHLLGLLFARIEAHQPPWSLPAPSGSGSTETLSPLQQPAVAISLEQRAAGSFASDTVPDLDDDGLEEWSVLLRRVVDIATRCGGYVAELEGNRVSLLFLDGSNQEGWHQALEALQALAEGVDVERCRAGVGWGPAHLSVWTHQGVRRLLARGTALTSACSTLARSSWGEVRLAPELGARVFRAGQSPGGEVQVAWRDLRAMIRRAS
jgi:pSer/pThr/pTyr-binding forkhead associated (FHA) protein